MEYVYAVTSAQEFSLYQSYARSIDAQLCDYLHFLECTYRVTDLPNCIVFASAETATRRISDIPLPGYTNEYRTVFCPELSVWKDIYLRQLEDGDIPEVRSYYESKLTDNHVLQILGHEFVHHSDLFLDEAYEKARWFEEGMCEYISRLYFLSEAQFREDARINQLLTDHYETLRGVQPLASFCADTYTGSYCDIFYFYWKSFLKTAEIVGYFNGDTLAVFREYRRWYDTGASCSLSEWFQKILSP